MLRRVAGILAVSTAVVAASYVFEPARQADATVVGGPIILMGIDAEDGGPGGHGPTAVYQNVVSDLLANASKGSGILVIGGGKSPTDNVTSFWNAIGSGLGQTVTYVNGAAVGTVSFASYEVVAVASDESNTPGGGLTAAENTAISSRDQDFADHVNSGGGLLGFSQTGLAAPWYGYLDAIGAFSVTSGGGSDITATPDGTAVGIDDSLDVCCWHDDYVTFPSFLAPLAHYAGTTRVAAIGGQRVIVLRECTPAEATISVARPAAGTMYVNDVASGPSGSTLAGVFGPTLTVKATTSSAVNTVNFEVDGSLVGTDSTTPFELAVAVPSAGGIHSVRVTGFHATLPCITRATVQFLVPDPAVAARGLGVAVERDVPAGQVVTAGGVTVSGKGGSPAPVTVVDRSVPPVDRVTAVSDTASGSALSSPITANASSKVTGVSLLGGVVTADLLETKVAASYNASTGAVSTSTAGSRIVRLRVNGTDVVDVSENRAIDIPRVGTLVVMEKLVTVVGRRAEVSVNALHLFLDAGYDATEIVLGSSYAGVNFLADAFDGPASDLIRRPDDLHSGTDAGNTRATATTLAPGLYAGGLTRNDPSDFYKFESRQGQRLVAVVKPADRTRLTVLEGPNPVLTRETPDLDLVLTDPDGLVRARSQLAVVGSEPQKVEINADKPFAPMTATGTWVLEVRRRGGSVDGSYTVDFAVLPVPLREQNDADQPGDAGDTCATGRHLVLPPNALDDQMGANVVTAGVIRDSDPADFYTLDVVAGRSVVVTLKPDELLDGADLDLYVWVPTTAGGVASCTSGATATRVNLEGLKAAPEFVALLPAVTTGRYVVEVRRVNAVANYYLTFADRDAQPRVLAPDARTGTDAGNSCGTAMPVSSGAFQGRLGDLPTHDVEDWYSVTLAAGADLLAVMKPSDPSDFVLELYGPSCTRMPAGLLTSGNLPASAPEAVNVADAPPGVYRIRVLRDPAVAAGNYLVGLVVTP